MVGSYTNTFGGSTVKPSQVSFLALSMSASTTLAWPTEAQESGTYVASQINVTATAPSLTLTMPPANQGSTGPATQVTNVGTNPFQLLDNTGVQIVNLTAGLTWQISLTDNTTVAGTWQAIQIGATTSSAQASALADNLTIQANGTVLQTFIRETALSTNTTITSGYRGEGILWTGAIGTLTLDSIANLTAGWHALIKNEGTDVVTLRTTGGATIDGAATLSLPPGFSLIIVCAVSGFFTFCNTPNPLAIAYGGTGATTANQALTNFGGSTIGLNIFTAPSAASIIALLGLTQTSLTESSVSTNQVLNSASTQTAFICTAALSLTLPLTTGLTKTFLFAAYAQGGTVTIIPNAADKINGGSVGANYTLASGTSIMMTTDAAGNWWPLFLNPGTGTVTSVGLTAPPIFVVTNAPITSSGSINLALANGSVNTVFAGPASGSSAAPTFRPLVAADIPIFGASGVSHASGAVPDPGAVAGTTKFLCEDGTFSVPTTSAAASPTGSMTAYGGFTAPTGWLLCDGSAVSRATYSALLGVITLTSVVTISIASPGVVTWASHGMVAGDAVSFETTGTLPTGIVVGTQYYVSGTGLTVNSFQFSATQVGTSVNTSGSQSGIQTGRRTPYGCGDGTTTFNVPDRRGRISLGLDNMGGVAANRVTQVGSGIYAQALGSTGGDQLMQFHLHTLTLPSGDGSLGTVGTNYQQNGNPGTLEGAPTSTTGGGGSQNMPPVIADNWIIKT